LPSYRKARRKNKERRWRKFYKSLGSPRHTTTGRRIRIRLDKDAKTNGIASVLRLSGTRGGEEGKKVHHDASREGDSGRTEGAGRDHLKIGKVRDRHRAGEAEGRDAKGVRGRGLAKFGPASQISYKKRIWDHRIATRILKGPSKGERVRKSTWGNIPNDSRRGEREKTPIEGEIKRRHEFGFLTKGTEITSRAADRLAGKGMSLRSSRLRPSSWATGGWQEKYHRIRNALLENLRRLPRLEVLSTVSDQG